MAINLSNVNITIQQFQAVSNGEYNAGEARAEGSERIDTALLIQPQDFWYNARMRKNRFIGQDRC